MTEADRGLVRRKLALMARNLGDLGSIEGLSVAEFVDDRFRHKGTERLLQEVIEAAVDVNLHLLRVLGRATATDYYTSFVLLGEAGVLPSELAAALAPAAGVRNRLVHEYDDSEGRTSNRKVESTRAPARARDERASRLPVRAAADALDVLPGLGDDAGRLKQNAGRPQGRIDRHRVLRFDAVSLGAKAVAPTVRARMGTPPRHLSQSVLLAHNQPPVNPARRRPATM